MGRSAVRGTKAHLKSAHCPAERRLKCSDSLARSPSANRCVCVWMCYFQLASVLAHLMIVVEPRDGRTIRNPQWQHAVQGVTDLLHASNLLWFNCVRLTQKRRKVFFINFEAITHDKFRKLPLLFSNAPNLSDYWKNAWQYFETLEILSNLKNENKCWAISLVLLWKTWKYYVLIQIYILIKVKRKWISRKTLKQIILWSSYLNLQIM